MVLLSLNLGLPGLTTHCKQDGRVGCQLLIVPWVSRLCFRLSVLQLSFQTTHCVTNDGT